MTEPLGPDYDDDIDASTVPDKDARMWAVLAHLSPLLGWAVPFAGNIVLPLLVWLLKRDESPFIDYHGKEAVNFQITVTIALAVSSLLIFVCVGFFTTPAIAVGALVLMVIAAIKANGGEAFRYPFTLRLIK